MSYSSGFLNKKILVLNRKTAQSSKFGVDGDGIDWECADMLSANVTYTKGISAMTAGAINAYGIKLVRMRWTDKITMRSRVKYDGNIYKVLPETFHADKTENTIQFQMVNECLEYLIIT
jgi:head-tail adaptor